jgi:hypothetical protein
MPNADGIMRYDFGLMHDGGDQMVTASGSLDAKIARLGDLMNQLFTVFRSEIASGQLTQLHAQWNQVSSLGAHVVRTRGRETNNAASGMSSTENQCAALFDDFKIV